MRLYTPPTATKKTVVHPPRRELAGGLEVSMEEVNSTGIASSCLVGRKRRKAIAKTEPPVNRDLKPKLDLVVSEAWSTARVLTITVAGTASGLAQGAGNRNPNWEK